MKTIIADIKRIKKELVTPNTLLNHSTLVFHPRQHSFGLLFVTIRRQTRQDCSNTMQVIVKAVYLHPLTQSFQKGLNK